MVVITTKQNVQQQLLPGKKIFHIIFDSLLSISKIDV